VGYVISRIISLSGSPHAASFIKGVLHYETHRLGEY